MRFLRFFTSLQTKTESVHVRSVAQSGVEKEREIMQVCCGVRERSAEPRLRLPLYKPTLRTLFVRMSESHHRHPNLPLNPNLVLLIPSHHNNAPPPPSHTRSDAPAATRRPPQAAIAPQAAASPPSLARQRHPDVWIRSPQAGPHPPRHLFLPKHAAAAAPRLRTPTTAPPRPEPESRRPAFV